MTYWRILAAIAPFGVALALLVKFAWEAMR